MGKSCSCLSAPKEHKNVNIDKEIGSFSDIEYTQIPNFKTNYDPEMTSLLTNGYIRSTMQSFNMATTSIPKYTDIISLCCEYYDNDMPLIRKRCIFTSIMHLNLCIDEIPSNILDESIFFFKMNEIELFSHIPLDLLLTNKYNFPSPHPSNKSSSNTIMSLSSSTTFKPLLIKYLLRKYSSGLLLLFSDNKSWTDISHLLSNISDTFYMNNRRYNSLKTDTIFWKNEYKKSRFTVPLCDIISELNENNLKFYPSMEIIKQSNPTLIPMKTFDFNQYKLQNGCHGMTWIDDIHTQNINYNYTNIQIKQMEINNNSINELSDSECMNFTYCVGEEEFLQSDSENEITINSKELLQSHELYGFTDDSDCEYHTD